MATMKAKKRARSGDVSNDYRWKKRKKEIRESRQATADDSADAVPDEPVSQHVAQVKKREPSEKIRARERAARERRRERHQLERSEVEGRLSEEPGEFLWEKYVEWAGDRLSSVERKVEKWNAEQVVAVQESERKLVDEVKRVVGEDYVAQGNWKKKKNKVAGVACLVITSSALRAVRLATSVYDGRPVGKLFGKHIKVEVQREWLEKCCRNGLAPSAAGTAKRVGRLVEEGRLTMKHTVCVVVDFGRDKRERNILDFDSTREELMEFLYTCCRERIASGDMKVILYVGGNEARKAQSEEKEEEEET